MGRAGKPAPGPLTQAIAAILRAQQGRLNVSDVEIAKHVTFSRSQLNGLLNGTKHFDMEQLDQVCYALGLDAIDVIADADRETAFRHASKDWPATSI